MGWEVEKARVEMRDLAELRGSIGSILELCCVGGEQRQSWTEEKRTPRSLPFNAAEGVSSKVLDPPRRDSQIRSLDSYYDSYKLATAIYKHLSTCFYYAAVHANLTPFSGALPAGPRQGATLPSSSILVNKSNGRKEREKRTRRSL